MSEEKFTVHRMHKSEEYIENQVTDWVTEWITEWFGIDEIDELTPEQLAEVQEFYEGMNEYSPMCIGFSNIINYVENIHWEQDQEVQENAN